ncbi:helix-turn-helix domain-containing protein [Citrobacter sp.]|uniref:helix-turn-helix domain-containing protein n=1 Tax=Citrobacter sp. TaxID=1896336 RepID=UPI003FA5BD74
MDKSGVAESQFTRSLTFTILSKFLEQPEFIHFLIHINRQCTTNSVSQLLESAPQRNWNLSLVAKSLCLSSSLLKKKLKDENTCYSKIITNCRMTHAIKLLQTCNGNIDKISYLCGYKSTSYFISVFKSFYGITPYKFMKNAKN